MNVKSAALRVTNKRLKTELKECKRMIVIKDNANLSLSARKDACSNLISHLEDNIENQLNENRHLGKINAKYLNKYYASVQERLELEGDLAVCKRKLDKAETEAMEAKDLTKKFEENIDRLNTAIAKLTKENENFRDKGIARKVKNIFKKKRMKGSAKGEL